MSAESTPRQEAGRESGRDPEEFVEPVAEDAISAPDAQGRPRRVTRRFPLFTRDTARPEGGGRAAPGDAPAPARQWPVLTVLSGVGLGLLLTALDVFRVGTVLIGLSLLAGAVLRWALPDVGMLAVRSRFTDMITYGVLGLAIVLLALMAQPKPLLEIPFLDDTLHFTIRT
ncbi:membrane protein [Streptomyces minutiscleroticus]|uniref:Membrane protein n=1 Tax=Streptomyces minutiscleroticus TaxID=68238 RepID=A0A918KNI5_9ACTN|nr:membrane protein [Streptomyces minutiscleroticus]